MPEGLEIIDAHGHIGLYPKLHLAKLPLEQSIALSRSLGIGKIVCSHMRCLGGDVIKGNAELFAAAETYPDTIYCYVYYSPQIPKESLGEIEKYIGHSHFMGVKIHPREENIALSDSRYEPLWEYAQAKRFPVLSHTWKTEPQNDPALFGPILKRWPQLKLLIGHSGGTRDGYLSCYELVRSYPNVYMDINGFLYSDTWLERMAEEISTDRLVFGTDQMFNDPRVTLGRVALADLKDDIKKKILTQNFLDMLNK